MNIVNICPTCHKSISATALVDIIVTYREDLTGAEIYEQGWHKECYPPAPALLAACEYALSALALMDADEGTAADKLRAAIAAAKVQS